MGRRAGRRGAAVLAGIHVRGMHEAPALVYVGVIEQPRDGALAAPCDAVIDLFRLLGDVDVDGRGGVDRVQSGERLAQAIRRHGAQRMRREAESHALRVALWLEPFEQAQIDGANRWQIFWHVTLPMIRPAILATVFIRLMDALRTVDEVWMLTGGGPAHASDLLSIQVFDQGFQLSRPGYASAIATLMLAFTLVVAIIQLGILARAQRSVS